MFFLVIPITQFNNFQFFGFVFAFVSFIVAILFLIKYLQFKKGEKGEKIVNDILKSLDNYNLFRNIKVADYGDIDHLLIYQNNIFIIETKYYSGDVEVYGDDWYLNGAKIKSPSIQIKKITAKFKEVLGIKIWLNCLIVPIIGGNLKVRNSSVDIVKPNELINFLNNKRSTLQSEFLSSLNDRIKSLQITYLDRITLKGLFNSWWFLNYRKFFIFGLLYGTIYLIGTDIFSFIISKVYNIDLGLPEYTSTEDILAVFYVGVLPLLFGKIIFDVLKIDLRIELFNIGGMTLLGWLPFFIYNLFKSPYLIGELAELIARLVAILISYFILKIFKFKLNHIYLK